MDYKRGIIVCALVSILAIGWAAAPQEAEAAWTSGTIGDYQYWYWDGDLKFRYNNNVGQWWHLSTIGFTWYTLSATGRSSTFIGDGGTYVLGNGLNYRYVAATCLK